MKLYYRHRSHLMRPDLFMIDLFTDREKYHLFWGHSRDREFSSLLPLPGKPIRLPFKAAPHIHNYLLPHHILTRRMMPIKNRERS